MLGKIGLFWPKNMQTELYPPPGLFPLSEGMIWAKNDRFSRRSRNSRRFFRKNPRNRCQEGIRTAPKKIFFVEPGKSLEADFPLGERHISLGRESLEDAPRRSPTRVFPLSSPHRKDMALSTNPLPAKSEPPHRDAPSLCESQAAVSCAPGTVEFPRQGTRPWRNRSGLARARRGVALLYMIVLAPGVPGSPPVVFAGKYVRCRGRLFKLGRVKLKSGAATNPGKLRTNNLGPTAISQ
jgi:hypothetical protein